jgi:fibronectin-binding autotransporter adhesin
VPELKIRAGRLSGNDNSTTRTMACPITLAGDVTLGGNDWSSEPSASLIFQGAVTLTGNRLLNVVNCSSGKSVSFTGNIGDAGQGYKLTVYGNGGNRSLVVSGNNTYGGGTEITGTDANFPVCVDSNTGLGTGRLTVTQGNACFRSAGPSIASLAGAGGTVTLGTTGIDTTLTMGGDNSSSTFSGALVSASGRKGHIVKTGAGTLTLPGALTYNGTTTVNGGTLLVNGTLSANANAVTVSSGGTLGGTGTVNRAVSVGSGGGLSPGVDLTMGTLSTSNLALAAGCTSVFHLGAVGSGDRVAVNGNLSLEGTIVVPPTGGIALGSHVIMTYTGTFGMPSRPVIQTPPGRPATLKVDTDRKEVMLEVASAGTVVMIR